MSKMAVRLVKEGEHPAKPPAPSTNLRNWRKRDWSHRATAGNRGVRLEWQMERRPAPPGEAAVDIPARTLIELMRRVEAREARRSRLSRWLQAVWARVRACAI